MNILLAADGSSYTVKAAQYLVSHQQMFQGASNLHLLHVHRPLPAGLAVDNARRILGDDAVDDYYKEESLAALRPAEEILRAADMSYTPAWRLGMLEVELQAYARENAIDLIVMGSHGHSRLAGVFLGSAATKILACTTLPVLIIR